MVERRGIERAGEHTRYLAHTLFSLDLVDARDGQVGAHLLGDDVVLVCKRRDLRQVRDDDDLRVTGELGDPAGDRRARRAADTLVDLVEHDCAVMTCRGVGAMIDAFEREQDARELSAGCDAAERARARGGRRAVQELDGL